MTGVGSISRHVIPRFKLRSTLVKLVLRGQWMVKEGLGDDPQKERRFKMAWKKRIRIKARGEGRGVDHVKRNCLQFQTVRARTLTGKLLQFGIIICYTLASR